MACCECDAATKRMSPPVAVLTHCTSPVPEKARRSAEEVPTGVARRQRPCLSRASRDKDGASSQVLPPQAYSLHASVAWQDIVSLRARVRQLEATLHEQKQRHSVLEKEKEQLVVERREAEEQKSLQNVVGQHQQMEYIRNVFRKFVETLPAGQSENEGLIPVLMAFFQFAPEEAKTIQSRRSQTSQAFWSVLPSWRS